MSAADDIAAPVKNGVCLWCGSGVLESGEHVRDDLDPCATIPRLAALLAATEAERDEAKQAWHDLDGEIEHYCKKLEAAEKERDEAVRDAVAVREKMYHNAANLDFCIKQRMELEAREAALREALTRIADATEMTGDGVLEDMTGPASHEMWARIQRARAALVASSPEGENRG